MFLEIRLWFVSGISLSYRAGIISPNHVEQLSVFSLLTQRNIPGLLEPVCVLSGVPGGTEVKGHSQGRFRFRTRSHLQLCRTDADRLIFPV